MFNNFIYEPKYKKKFYTFYYDLNSINKIFDPCKLEIEKLTVNTGETDINKPSYTTVSIQVNDNQSSITRFYNWARGRRFDFNIEIADPAGCVIGKKQFKNAILINTDGINGKIDCFSFIVDYFTVDIADQTRIMECQLSDEYTDYLNKQIIDNINSTIEKEYIFSDDLKEIIRKTFDTEQVSGEDMLI